MEISYEEMSRMVSPKLMRMILQMRLEVILKEEFGSTDAELKMEEDFQEMGELEDIDGYYFGFGFEYEELFMVRTEIEESPGASIPVRMQCN